MTDIIEDSVSVLPDGEVADQAEDVLRTDIPQDAEIRRRANTYFFAKVAFNLFLIVLGAVFIALFLRNMQGETAMYKQREGSVQALTEAVEILETNAQDAAYLTSYYHQSNQEMLYDLESLFTSGLFVSLQYADSEARSEVFADIVERSGVDYLFLVDDSGNVLVSQMADYVGVNLADMGVVTQEQLQRLVHGTGSADGESEPVTVEINGYTFYFYSVSSSYGEYPFVIVLGAEGRALETQIASLKDVSVVLSRTTVGNGGFMFAVDTESETFLYYAHDGEVLTGENALEAGLSAAALEDGYAGMETINGTTYYCVSKTFGDQTVICAVADAETIFANDKYVLIWSITGFVLAMLACLIYAVIVRNDFVRRSVQTKRKTFKRKNGVLIFDISVFKKVFPLTIAAVVVLFFVSFYTQTLLEISQNIEKSQQALDEVSARYAESIENREIIQSHYDSRFLAKARLLSFLLEEDPSALNEPTDRVYSVYDEDGNKHYLLDDEGNVLTSVRWSENLRKLCESNSISSIYVYDEDGRVIATSAADWYFILSNDPDSQSYVFREVLDGKVDSLVQEPMVSDQDEENQYIGVAFTYYTTTDEDGNTVYASRYDYEVSQGLIPDVSAKAAADAAEGEADEGAEGGAGTGTEAGTEPAVSARAPITAHHSLIQIGLDIDLTAMLLSTTDLGYVFSTDILSDGFIVVFDDSADHVCLYSPLEASVGQTAAQLGVPDKAFSGLDYYGFIRVNGTTYFQYYRYADGYFAATANPESSMYEARFIIALITALMSLIVILVLLGTVTFTTEEEEHLYATVGDSASGGLKDSKIFTIVLPSGNSASTVRAASRWDNRYIRWREKSPDQKLGFMISVLAGIMVLYIVLTIAGAQNFFGDASVIQYILSGNWDKGLNIFALSACALALTVVAIVVWAFRLLVRIVGPILGARGETIGHLLLSVVKYGGFIGAIFYCLYLVGVDSTSLLASAGILSLVIGLGAQSLIKDIIAGIFIVFEGEFRVGDIVTIGGYRGTVMDIGLRTTKIIGMDGNIKIYNNSEISGVLNMTKEASKAICDIRIEYGQDIDYVEEVLKREMPKLREDNPKIIDGPQLLGVGELGDSGVTMKIMAVCSEKDIKGVVRYLNKGILQIFYRNGIRVPYPHVTVVNQEGASQEDIQRVKSDDLFG